MKKRVKRQIKECETVLLIFSQKLVSRIYKGLVQREKETNQQKNGQKYFIRHFTKEHIQLADKHEEITHPH